MSNSAKARRQFSKAFKSEIVKLVLDGQRTVPEICKQHQLHESSVYAWLRQAKIESGTAGSDAMTSADKEELAQLRKEVRELKRENDFLRDAASYFAKAKK